MLFNSGEVAETKISPRTMNQSRYFECSSGNWLVLSVCVSILGSIFLVCLADPL